MFHIQLLAVTVNLCPTWARCAISGAYLPAITKPLRFMVHPTLTEENMNYVVEQVGQVMGEASR